MKETVGKKAVELAQKQPDTLSPIEQQRAMTQNYMKDLCQAVDRGFKKYPGDFFIHVETKREPLLTNVFRNYFIDRETCPTPNYDQSVFKYDRKKCEIQYFWTVPDRETCHHLKSNALLVVEEEKQLLKFVLEFDDGTLYKLCKKLNGEKEDSPLLKERN